MAFERKVDGEWEAVSQAEAFRLLTKSTFRFPALAMEQMEQRPMNQVADCTVGLTMRFNPEEVEPCSS